MIMKPSLIPKKVRTSGFTLLEVMLSIGILSAIALICVNFLARSFMLRQKVLDLYPFEKIMNRIAKDISGAYILPYASSPFGTTPVTQLVPKFVYQESNSQLTFTVVNNESLVRNSFDSNIAMVSYYTKVVNGKTELIRVVDTVMASDPSRQLPTEGVGTSMPLAEDIKNFSLKFWNGKDFQTTWNSTSGTELDKFPKMVKISLTLYLKPRSFSTDKIELPLERIVFVQSASGRDEVNKPGIGEYTWQ